jgi:hypothetical protein
MVGAAHRIVVLSLVIWVIDYGGAIPQKLIVECGIPVTATLKLKQPKSNF